MKIKQLFIKLGLWEEPQRLTIANLEESYQQVLTYEKEERFIKEALRHYCEPCNRWFSDVRGKLMHDRHRHKPKPLIQYDGV